MQQAPDLDIRVQFTEREIEALQRHPLALHALADLHEVWATEADAIDFQFGDAHDERARTVRFIAHYIEAVYDNGDDPYEGVPK